MIRLFVYENTTGKILRLITGLGDEFAIDNTSHGEGAIEADLSLVNPYVIVGRNPVLAERPAMPATINGLVISNIPDSAQIKIENTTYDVTGSTVTLSFSHSGIYTVTLTAFPYLDKNFEVSV